MTPITREHRDALVVSSDMTEPLGLRLRGQKGLCVVPPTGFEPALPPLREMTQRRRAPHAAATRLVWYPLHDIRHERFFQLGPLYITTAQRHFDATRNGFELGRDYEREKHRKELSTVATMLSVIQESMTKRQR